MGGASWEVVNHVEVFFEACEVPEEDFGDAVTECEDGVTGFGAFEDGEAHEDDFAVGDGELQVPRVEGG